MKFNNYIFILFIIFLINFLLGCQQVQEVSEQESDTIEIGERVVEPIDEELEKEFDDGLDEALQELEEVEDIAENTNN